MTVLSFATESTEAGTVSLMSHGYDTLLSPRELADLVAFLAQAKAPLARSPSRL